MSKHLTDQQLIAFRDGVSRDRRVREHLVTCDECQERLDDARYALAGSPRVAAADADSAREGPHLTGDLWLAYQDNALSPRRHEQVQRHIRSCDRCLTLYRRFRATDPRARYRSPSAASVRRLRAAMRPRPVLDLGRLLLVQVGEMLRLIHQPPSHAFLGVREEFGVECSRPTEAFGLRAPSSQEDLADGPDELAAPRDEPGEPLRSKLDHPSSAASRRRRARSVRRDDERPPEVTLEANGLILVLSVEAKAGRALLKLLAMDRKADEPARDLPVRVQTAGEVLFSESTDDLGRLEIPFPADSLAGAILEIGGRWPSSVRLG